MKNMFIDIYEIAAAGRPIDVELDLGEQVDPDQVVLEYRGARLRGRVRPGGRGVDLQAHLDSSLRLNCSRCLEPVEWPVSADFSLTLVPEAMEFAAGEAQVTEEDASLYYTREGKADLSEIVLEQINLSLPLKPICSPDCRGLCPTCGANRNDIECGCREVSIDPRLAPLLEIKKRTDSA